MLPISELKNNLVSDISVNADGKLVVRKGGADTVLPFSKKLTFVTGSGVMGYGDKTIVTLGKPRIIVTFTQVSNLTSYKNLPPTGIYLTDDDYNVIIWQGAYTLRHVTENSFDVHNTQGDKSYPFCYLYGY